MRVTIALLFSFVLLASLVKANESEYVFKGGYYWKDNVAYEKYKEWWQEQVYYRQPYYHYRYEWKWQWAYRPINVVQQVVESTTDFDARMKLLLEIAKARDEAKNVIDKRVVEQAHLLEAVKTLGFDFSGIKGLPYPQTYPGYGLNYNAFSLGAYGAQGTTIYGYSSITDIYGDNSVAAAMQAFARSTDRVVELGGIAHGRLAEATDKHGFHAYRLAELMIKRDAYKIFMDHRADGAMRIETKQFGTAPPVPDVPFRITAKNVRINHAEFKRMIITPMCGKCHGEKPVENMLTLTVGVDALPLATRQMIWTRINHKDVNKRMPKGGPAMDVELRTVWEAHLHLDEQPQLQPK